MRAWVRQLRRAASAAGSRRRGRDRINYESEGRGMRHGDADSGRGHRRGRPRGRGPGGFGFGPPGFGPPFGGPGGFGPGFPFGGGRRGRGGRRNRGDVRSAVLLLISEQPMHGYQLIGEIAERSEGMWRPSAGSVYPVLQQLEDEGLVRIERVEGRRVVHLTEAGTAYVAERSDELGAVFDQVGGSVDDGVMELFGLMQQAGMAAAQVAQAGTPQQVARAHQVLERTRQELYRILADGDQPEAGGGQSETGGDHPEADGDQPETL